MCATRCGLCLGAALMACAIAAAPVAGQGGDPAKEPPAKKSVEPAKDRPDAKAREQARAAAEFLEKAYAGAETPEAVRMLTAIARGSQMGPGEGWFGPAKTRYNYAWLAGRHGVTGAGGIARAQFQGTDKMFARLDRDRDGRITANDLDWSERSMYMQMASFVGGIFRRLNAKGDGRLTREELQAFFDKAAGGKDHLTAEDLRDIFLAGGPRGFQPGDAPQVDSLVRGLFAGEIGSLQEGPRLGEPAPDFTLKTHDGKQTVRLSQLIGPKPVVLVFGNFTCGPFRAAYPLVEQVYQRHRADATFLAVYVREAHPTDGWRMSSNDEGGVSVAQPRTTDERRSVAQQCHRFLKPSMPLVVDEINDPVGNAYSGMPARLYVLDREGKVAYKSGRGPFGFKTGEMEQALVMALLEQAGPPTVKPTPGGPAEPKVTGR
jgi:thiol-disulfide isomerase/thioredoxin